MGSWVWGLGSRIWGLGSKGLGLEGVSSLISPVVIQQAAHQKALNPKSRLSIGRGLFAPRPLQQAEHQGALASKPQTETCRWSRPTRPSPYSKPLGGVEGPWRRHSKVRTVIAASRYQRSLQHGGLPFLPWGGELIAINTTAGRLHRRTKSTQSPPHLEVGPVSGALLLVGAASKMHRALRRWAEASPFQVGLVWGWIE